MSKIGLLRLRRQLANSLDGMTLKERATMGTFEKRLSDLEERALQHLAEAPNAAEILAGLETTLQGMGLSATAEEATARGFDSRVCELAKACGLTVTELHEWLIARAGQ
jgi:hypothetical protein